MPPRTDQRALWAYVSPFALFLILQALPGAVRGIGDPHSIWTAHPEYWVYPLQTLACAALLFYFRREYPKTATAAGLLTGAAAGILVLAIWIAPQLLWLAPPRMGEGFNPDLLRETGWYGAEVGARFVRLAVVVPLLEEVFWRGFLLRYLVREDFTAVALGTFTHLSFWAVALGFMLEHNRPDWPAALAAGVLYNLVAVRTRSLPACVLAHAVTNLLLGFYIMETRQWGFW